MARGGGGGGGPEEKDVNGIAWIPPPTLVVDKNPVNGAYSAVNKVRPALHDESSVPSPSSRKGAAVAETDMITPREDPLPVVPVVCGAPENMKMYESCFKLESYLFRKSDETKMKTGSLPKTGTVPLFTSHVKSRSKDTSSSAGHSPSSESPIPVPHRVATVKNLDPNRPVPLPPLVRTNTSGANSMSPTTDGGVGLLNNKKTTATSMPLLPGSGAELRSSPLEGFYDQPTPQLPPKKGRKGVCDNVTRSFSLDVTKDGALHSNILMDPSILVDPAKRNSMPSVHTLPGGAPQKQNTLIKATAGESGMVLHPSGGAISKSANNSPENNNMIGFPQTAAKNISSVDYNMQEIYYALPNEKVGGSVDDNLSSNSAPSPVALQDTTIRTTNDEAMKTYDVPVVPVLGMQHIPPSHINQSNQSVIIPSPTLTNSDLDELYLDDRFFELCKPPDHAAMTSQSNSQSIDNINTIPAADVINNQQSRLESALDPLTGEVLKAAPGRFFDQRQATQDQKPMQFYDEDFELLMDMGYSREDIKKALMVANNNFSIARKILKEYPVSKK